MATNLDRRDFLKRSLAASTGAALALSLEEKALLAHAEEKPQPSAAAPDTKDFPTGKIGAVRISRLICGGNLISGYAHSRDLIYVSSLLKQYFTDDRVFETLQVCEANGINAAMLKLDADTIRIINKYWRERGGAIQWIAQITNPDDMPGEIRNAIDLGAVGVFTTGQMGDELVRNGQVDKLAKAVQYIKDNGAIAGVGCHEIAAVLTCEKEGVNPDFYMKTFHSHDYWSAGPAERHDSVFEETPERTIEVMQQVQKPWVAFKVLAAGAIPPRKGFEFAVRHGADFLCVGMFDFQVAEDAVIARNVLSEHRERPRPWRA